VRVGASGVVLTARNWAWDELQLNHGSWERVQWEV
jgi:hypothetical protein